MKPLSDICDVALKGNLTESTKPSRLNGYPGVTNRAMLTVTNWYVLITKEGTALSGTNYALPKSYAMYRY
jgi:hypothetical protein